MFTAVYKSLINKDKLCVTVLAKNKKLVQNFLQDAHIPKVIAKRQTFMQNLRYANCKNKVGAHLLFLHYFVMQNKRIPKLRFGK